MRNGLMSNRPQQAPLSWSFPKSRRRWKPASVGLGFRWNWALKRSRFRRYLGHDGAVRTSCRAVCSNTSSGPALPVWVLASWQDSVKMGLIWKQRRKSRVWEVERFLESWEFISSVVASHLIHQCCEGAEWKAGIHTGCCCFCDFVHLPAAARCFKRCFCAP